METKLMEGCKVAVVENTPCAILLSVEVPHSAVAKEIETVFGEIQKVAQIPGFRAGKAPQDMVKKSFEGKAREKVIENLIHKTAFDALKSQGVDPIDMPSIDKVTFDFDKPFQYVLKAERHPEFKVKDYKNIKIIRTIAPVTDAKIKENINALRERNACLEPSASDTVAPAHVVTIDYECTADGQPLSDMKTKNFVMDLSAAQMIPGLKEGLIGAKKGAVTEVPVTFPGDYPAKNLAGKKVIFLVSVLEIKEKVLPALDDEFARDLGLEKLADLEGKLKESLEGEEKKRQDQDVEKQIIAHLVEKNNFPVPESLVEGQLTHMWNRTLDYFKRRGVQQQNLDKEKVEWRKKYRTEAENNVRLSYVLSAVATAEKLDVTDADIDQERTRMLTENIGREQEAEKYFEENKDAIRASLKEEKIFAYLLSNAAVKEETKK